MSSVAGACGEVIASVSSGERSLAVVECVDQAGEVGGAADHAAVGHAAGGHAVDVRLPRVRRVVGHHVAGGHARRLRVELPELGVAEAERREDLVGGALRERQARGGFDDERGDQEVGVGVEELLAGFEHGGCVGEQRQHVGRRCAGGRWGCGPSSRRTSPTTAGPDRGSCRCRDVCDSRWCIVCFGVSETG